MNKKKIHLVIPMSGQGNRYQAAGYTQPKPLIPVSGTPMIERMLSNFSPDWPVHFILAENHRDSGLAECLAAVRPAAELSFIAPHKLGPSFALLSSLKSIPADEAVLVSYCDYGLQWDHQNFTDFVTSSDCDGCLISYRGFHAHYLSKVNYAFSRLVDGRVVEVREKGNFTDNRENEFASAGAYYFSSRRLLEDAIAYQMKNNLQVNGEFYTSLTMQAVLLLDPKAHVRVYEVPAFYQWGTPADLQDFEYWEKTFSQANAISGKAGTVPQVLMPMAGFGSRFKELTPTPKPLIHLEGVPMYVNALASLPLAQRTVIVTRKEIADEVARHQSRSAVREIVALDYVPEGQALTTELGISKLDPNLAVLVSACDHGTVLSLAKWENFVAEKAPQVDAAIFTVKSFPGVRRKPEAYSYVKVIDGQSLFPDVVGVSVKKPYTSQPEQEHLLVGTFWFRSARLLAESISELKKENARVNGELYLDGVFNSMIARGAQVVVIELGGYMNWGDPDSLKEVLYWQENFCGHKLSKRETFPGVNW